MINNCASCNKTPKVKIVVSCDNDKCLEFGEEFYVWEWQKLNEPGEGEKVVSLSI